MIPTRRVHQYCIASIIVFIFVTRNFNDSKLEIKDKSNGGIDPTSYLREAIPTQNTTVPPPPDSIISQLDQTPSSKSSTLNNSTTLEIPEYFNSPEDLHKYIDVLELGWSNSPTEWMMDLCSEVVHHFTRFPLTKKDKPKDVKHLPFLSTVHAVQSVCTMKILKSVAAAVNARIYLHAGSHLGALVHGQPIPWDDDVDVFMDFRKMSDIWQACSGNGIVVHHPSGLRIRCSKYINALKVWLHYDGMEKMTKRKAWYSPFVDLFFYKVVDDRLVEFRPDGRISKSNQNYELGDYFPSLPYYFGGVYFLGPRAAIVEKRYNVDICMMGDFNHLIEEFIEPKYHSISRIAKMDCNQLKAKFVFRDREHDLLFVKGSQVQEKIYSSAKASKMETVAVQNLTLTQRQDWYKQPDTMGQELTNTIENLNIVEVDNSISPDEYCKVGPLKVIELNAERGRWWMEATSLQEVQEADIIILNEMDVGMARSDNQHTTRLMAHFLEMNYAFGVEFIELTQGNDEDRFNANSVPDFQGLHGNAFLTKCKISDTMIVRDPVGEYFSSRNVRLNANGTEKRLGGRMGLLGKVLIDGGGGEMVIGSIHKLGLKHIQVIKDYIGDKDAIVAGDQHGKYCSQIGLKNIVSSVGGKGAHFTWPASCDNLGRVRGDNICSNMIVVEEEKTTKPCVTYAGFSTKIGDHALTSVVLETR